MQAVPGGSSWNRQAPPEQDNSPHCGFARAPVVILAAGQIETILADTIDTLVPFPTGRTVGQQRPTVGILRDIADLAGIVGPGFTVGIALVADHAGVHAGQVRTFALGVAQVGGAIHAILGARFAIVGIEIHLAGILLANGFHALHPAGIDFGTG